MKNYGLSISNDGLAILANSNVSVRDRAIFMILAESGLRASELTELDRASVLPQRCVIRNGQVQTCGHGEVKQSKYRCRVREFFVGPAAFAALQEYLAATLTEGIEQPLFCKRDGRRLQPWVIRKTIREMCVKLDQLPVGIHALHPESSPAFCRCWTIHSQLEKGAWILRFRAIPSDNATDAGPTPPRLSSRDRVISLVSKAIARLASIARSVSA